ncbi:MAG: hypothetical protein J5J06_18115 [Phycisphaerae bacterium]|nr:hypothetical protein [Phycisphaerae bacterium]
MTRICKNCEYIIDGLPENRCPECGERFDPGDPTTFDVMPRQRCWFRDSAYVLFVFIAVLAAFARHLMDAIPMDAEIEKWLLSASRELQSLGRIFVLVATAVGSLHAINRRLAVGTLFLTALLLAWTATILVVIEWLLGRGLYSPGL